jgi:DNA polymerase III delta prime subunit
VSVMDRDAILKECRETLERTRTPKSSNFEHLPPTESRADRWRREATEQEAEQERKRMLDRASDSELARLLAAAETDWQSRINDAVAAERSYWEQLLPELIALLRAEITAEIASVRLDVDALRHDQTKRRRARSNNNNVTELTMRRPA